MGDQEKVCVTGAGGYLASWVVKFLLSQGYLVHGTVRDPSDKKNAHLKKLDSASENLQLFKADLLDYEALCAAIEGCEGVFHVASPVPSLGHIATDPEVELMQPAVTGTRHVLNACRNAKVKKVVVVSSIGAVALNQNWPKGQAMDEKCWTDLKLGKAVKLWYCVAKTMAEAEAWEYVKRGELNIVTVCPSIIIGPMLQSTMNASSLFLLKLLKDGSESQDNGVWNFVDVRDAAEAILLVYRNEEAEGRYICSSYLIGVQDLVQKLQSLYPNYNYPKSFNEVETKVKLSTEKLQNLGWKYRPLEETLVDAVKSYEENGALGVKQSSQVKIGVESHK